MKNMITKIALVTLLMIPGFAVQAAIDNDGDGILNNIDNCRDVANEDQADFDGDGWGDACDDDTDNDGITDTGEEAMGTDAMDPDSDDDGITDLYDCAPTDASKSGFSDCYVTVVTPEPPTPGETPDPGDDDDDGDDDDGIEVPSVDTDGDGCADAVEIGRHTDVNNPDTDEDGIDDCNDNCPIVFNPEQIDSVGNGIGDVCRNDYDGDGVEDPIDNCIFMPNPRQADVDGDGVGDVCDPDSEYFGLEEPTLHAQGGGGSDGNGCTLIASATAGQSAWPLLALLMPLMLFGIRRRYK